MSEQHLYRISDFSPHLFWDVDRSKLDFEAHAAQIIKGTLEYGLMKDWKNTAWPNYSIFMIKNILMAQNFLF